MENKKQNDLIQSKKREDLYKKSIKNTPLYSGLGSGSALENSASTFVNIELPDDLKEPLISVNAEQLNANNLQNENPIQIKNKMDNVPYGVLKGGSKPTYREWNKTQKNSYVENPQQALILNSQNAEVNEREYRLNMLKEKIKNKKLFKHSNATTVSPTIPIPIIVKPFKNANDANTNNLDNLFLSQNLIQNPSINPSINPNQKSQETVNIVNNNLLKNGIIKKITTKTIRKKYTLGKSKIKKNVAVLLKDKQTKKKVLYAYKELKKKPINEVKQYLRDHGFMKSGSNAPNNVIRKMYESAMLTGDVTNDNRDTILHNFMNGVPE